MFDLHTASPSTCNSLASDTAGGPAREWADTLILEIIMERRQDRGAFIAPRGALAARLVALDASTDPTPATPESGSAQAALRSPA